MDVAPGQLVLELPLVEGERDCVEPPGGRAAAGIATATAPTAARPPNAETLAAATCIVGVVRVPRKRGRKNGIWGEARRGGVGAEWAGVGATQGVAGGCTWFSRNQQGRVFSR